MEIEHALVPGRSGEIPALLINPPHPHGAAVIVHGYGGSKEEQLGLGWRVAESGLFTCVIDLRGHGEHALPFDIHAGSDVDAAIRYCRHFGRVTAIGHSLGGRLALVSDADFCIALSPAIVRIYGKETRERLRTLRSYRVRPSEIEPLLAMHDDIRIPGKTRSGENTLILFAERDIPEIHKKCLSLKESGIRTVEIPGALHNDIYLATQTFEEIHTQLGRWNATGA